MRDGLSHQRIDQCRLAGTDFAEHGNLDAAGGQLPEHALQLMQLATQPVFFFLRTRAQFTQRFFQGDDGVLIVLVVEHMSLIVHSLSLAANSSFFSSAAVVMCCH